MNALLSSTRAELIRLTRWPATWIMIGVWLALNLMFGYVFNYVSYVTGDASTVSEGATRADLLADIAPSAFGLAGIQGMAMFGSAIMLILGGMAVGSGYGWGTWKTVFTQGPRRTAAFGGTALALGALVVLTVVLTFALDAGTSALIAVVEGQPITWPSIGDLAETFGAGLLILGSATALGLLVGTLARSAALAVGLGLVWAMAIENLLRGVSGLLGPLEYVTDVLPGTAAGSLVGGLMGVGAEGTDTPGVLTILEAGPAAALLGGYVLLFAGIAVALVRRRDVT
jgi:ABC-2 type transport system permease protein